MDKVSLFAEALLKTTLEERQRYLDDACGSNNELREEIDGAETGSELGSILGD